MAWPRRPKNIPRSPSRSCSRPEADHTGNAAALIWVNKPGAAKGIKKVVIPFFQVQFVVDSDTSAAAGTASSKTMVKLVGPTPAQMQAITDRLYAKLLADLAAAGLSVVSIQDARGYPNFAKLQDGGKPSGSKIDGHEGVNSLFFAPQGMTFYFLPTQDIAYTGAGVLRVASARPCFRRASRRSWTNPARPCSAFVRSSTLRA